MHQRFCYACLLQLFCFVSAGSLLAQADNSPVTLGVRRTLRSKTLGETRSLLVRLPGDYEKSGRTYPVLYKLDGEQDVFLQASAVVQYLVDMTDKAPDHIVVGIENTVRARDMEPGPGADKFIEFIRAELIPFVDRNYRTNGFRILAGQSSSAVFAGYAFLQDPRLFDAYILSSLGLSQSGLELFEKTLASSLHVRSAGRRCLFLAHGKMDPYDPDGSRTRNGAAFIARLRQTAPATVLIEQRTYDEEGHVPFPSLYDGLRWIYSHGPNRGRATN